MSLYYEVSIDDLDKVLKKNNNFLDNDHLISLYQQLDLEQINKVALLMISMEDQQISAHSEITLQLEELNIL